MVSIVLFNEKCVSLFAYLTVLSVNSYCHHNVICHCRDESLPITANQPPLVDDGDVDADSHWMQPRSGPYDPRNAY